MLSSSMKHQILCEMDIVDIGSSTSLFNSLSNLLSHMASHSTTPPHCLIEPQLPNFGCPIYNLCKTLGILVAMHLPQRNGVASKLQARWKSDYICWNQCNQSDHGWKVKLMLFNAMLTQVLFYGV